MNQPTRLALLLLMILAVPASANETLFLKGKAGPGAGKHIILVTGDEEYRSEESGPMLAKILSQRHGFDCTVLFSWTEDYINPNAQAGLRGLEALDSADLMILGTRFRRLDEERAAHVTRFLDAGKPVIGFRTATHAFAGPTRFGEGDGAIASGDFGFRVLGERWVSHHGAHKREGCRGVIEPGRSDHPILRGVADVFAPSDVYGVIHLTDADSILLRGAVTETLDPRSALLEGKKNHPMQPLAWLHTYTAPDGRTQGSSFCTTAGASVDFVSEDLRRLVVNAAYFLTGLEVPGRADVDTVDPFYPSFYGFIEEEEWFEEADLRPEDFGLGRAPYLDDPPGSPRWRFRPMPPGGRRRFASAREPWLRMDYGPFLSTAVGIGDGVAPVHKGIVVRLRTEDGEETDLQAVFDTDLLAWRCVWRGELELRGIVYDGPHGTFPRIEGEAYYRAAALPGAAPANSSASLGKDPRDEPWGPMPATLGRWAGLHLDGHDLVFDYVVGDEGTRVLERVWAEERDDDLVFVREVTVEGESRSGISIANPGEGGTTRARSGDVLRFAVGPSSSGPARTAASSTVPVHEAMRRSRPRWGEPLVTRGVIDDPLDEQGERRVIQAANTPARRVEIARGRQLELLDAGSSDGRTARFPTGVLRELSSTGPALREGRGLGQWACDAGNGRFERNELTGEDDLRLDGVTWRRGVKGRSLDFDGTAAAWLDELDLDLAEQDLTVAVWIHTTSDGTVFSVAPERGKWAPDGVTLFLRQKRLCLDVGWVGVVTGGPEIADGAWHHVAATWRHDGGQVRLFVDGRRVAEGELPLKDEDREDFVARFGWTNEDFPAVSRFSGYMDGAMLLATAVGDETIPALAATTGEPLVEAVVVRVITPPAAGARGVLGMREEEGRTVATLDIPAGKTDVEYAVSSRRGPRPNVLDWARSVLRESVGATRPFRVDRLTWPDRNPYGSWMRFGAFDFLPSRNGRVESAAIATWSGDVWRVDGLDEDLETLRWTRTATGLNQPFGVAVRGEELLVLGRDQITRLHDRNGDGEADFLENVTNAGRNSEHFHEPASGLLVAPDGSLLYHKAARHAKHALHSHHGTILRVSPDGETTSVVARGFRAPIGLGRLPDGSLLGSDQEGHWMPANRINLVRPVEAGAPPFFGNGWAAREAFDARVRRGGEQVHPAWDADAPMVPPLCWVHPKVDRSPSSQLFVDHPAWGPLRGSILGLSYGTGEVYLILREDVPVEGNRVVSQGGVVKLGLRFPTGLLAGRIHPDTGDLYVCGLFGWSSDRTAPGGFFRIRPRAESWKTSLNVPSAFRARPDGLELTFLHPLDRESAEDPARWSATAWDYRRTADYGSATYDLEGRKGRRTEWKVRDVSLSSDGRTARLEIRDFEPAMQVHVAWNIQDGSGRELDHEAFLTVHRTRAGE